MRPLYIDAAEARVSLDGPALRVSVPRKADRWFPLSRLSQVISSERADWRIEALLACARRGIVVGFLNGEGETVARCIGRVSARESLQERLEAFWLRDDAAALYRQWLGAMENMAMRSVLRRSGLNFEGCPDARALRRLFREGAVSTNALPAYRRIGREIHALLLVLATQTLADSQIDVARFNAADFNPARDLADLLFWDFQLARLRYLENRLLRMETAEAPPLAETAAYFEKRRERTERLARGLLRRLHNWLIEQG